ncbi:ABC transporter permease [Aquimarina gracilis]|uniref:ABC transporter permease n=1 Tax=Aquimarina gracilis TaxID=874422 RepID=A0ABU5ZZD0_9FLAO|nr:ABC transporter permease [Aquimarina gracilis]MEB3347216.1 ABC transporter permease [Aquimarina gracilis]
MFKNYIKIAWRNLLKNKLFSMINIFGLSIGLATCLLLTLYIMDETSYDEHHTDSDRIYRVAMEALDDQIATVSAPMAGGLKNDYPEIEEAARMLKFPNVDKFLLKDKNKDKQLYVDHGYYADSTFFKVLTYDFVYGNPKTALNQPNSIVISEEVSKKMFGDVNPINKVIGIEMPYAKNEYTVKGVFKDKYRSHINGKIFLSMKNSDMGQWIDQQKNWATNNLFYTYIKLKKGSSAAQLEAKFPDFVQKYIMPDMTTPGITKRMFLQPLASIYLTSDLQWEVATNGSMTYIYIFSAIAAFLLLIACVNFMNLSTARSEKRAREVGMRKVLGAKREALIFQFLGESMVLCILSLGIAIAVVFLMLPTFNTLTGKELALAQYPSIVFWILGFTLLTGLLSGLYPAFYLSSFAPITTLKGKLVNTFSATAIRKGLVVFQFTVSASLILVGGVIWQQMEFLQNKDLGFKKDQQLVIPLRSEAAANSYDTFKTELLKHPDVVSATAGDSYPGFEMLSDNSFYAEDKTMEDHVWTHYARSQDGYVKTLGYTLLYGRTFSTNKAKDSIGIILNEMAVKNLGYEPENAIGRKIYYEWDKEKFHLEIIGVIKDFNYKSLHEPITPFGITRITWGQANYFIATLRDGADYQSAIANIKSTWQKINPEIPFEYSFLDQDFEKNYLTEKQTSKVVFSFMFIAIFIACIGLFGLASFTTEQRKKEVGIRRVLGASIMGITSMHLKDFLKLVLLAMAIASPLAYYLGHKWLENFAYKIEMSWWLFASATGIALLIAFATVGFQVIKAAIANPVNSLRTE